MEFEVTPAAEVPVTESRSAKDAPAKEAAKPDSPGVDKQETKEERKFRLKFGKNEREVSEAELVMLGQKGWASDERFKSAAAKEREVKEALEKMDLDALIRKGTGKDKLEYAKEVLRAEIRKNNMSPEEREREERKANVEREESELSAREKRIATQKLEAQQQHYEETYDRELSEAIKSEGLPKNKYAVGRAVKIASEIVDMGLEPDWKLVVGEAKRQIQEELGELIDQLSDGVGFLGEDRARKISKMLVSKGMPKSEVARVVKQAEKAPESNQPVDSDEWFEKKRKEWSK